MWVAPQWWAAHSVRMPQICWAITITSPSPEPPPKKRPLAINFSSSWPQIGCFQKYGENPQIVHFNRVFHYFHHPFWGFSPYFWKHPDGGFVDLRLGCVNPAALLPVAFVARETIATFVMPRVTVLHWDGPARRNTRFFFTFGNDGGSWNWKCIPKKQHYWRGLLADLNGRFLHVSSLISMQHACVITLPVFARVRHRWNLADAWRGSLLSVACNVSGCWTCKARDEQKVLLQIHENFCRSYKSSGFMWLSHGWSELDLKGIGYFWSVRILYDALPRSKYFKLRKLGCPSWSSLCFSRYWGGSWGKLLTGFLWQNQFLRGGG